MFRAAPSRPMDSVIVQVIGEHPPLARAELDAIFDVIQGEALREVAPLTYLAKVPRGSADEIGRRGGLLRFVGAVLSEAPSVEELPADKIEVKGTYAVRATVLANAPQKASASVVEREVGARMKGGRVNLENPAHVFRVFVGERAWLTHEIYDREADDFEERAVKHRPFFQPVSLHPKFARALVNLTRVHDGQRLLDPFCGTAGILIEAGLVGARPIGIDAEPQAARGAALNLEHFGILGAAVHEGRAKDAVALAGGRVRAIATDPPYGRSATTMKMGARAVIEESAKAMAEVLEPGGRLAMCVPEPTMAEPLEGLLTRELSIPQRVHASLTRNYLVFRKAGGP